MMKVIDYLWDFNESRFNSYAYIILSLKERPIDVEIVNANTYLSYDKKTSSFIRKVRTLLQIYLY